MEGFLRYNFVTATARMAGTTSGRGLTRSGLALMNGPQQKMDETILRTPSRAASEALALSVTERPIVELLNVGKNYANNVAIESLTFSVEYGETIALLGRTGAGKSTVLNLIMGHIAPTSGTVRVLGVDPHVSSAELKGRMAVSFQTDCLLPWRTALQNVELGLEITSENKRARLAVASSWLDRVKLAPEHWHKVPRELSGGMRQRVSLARALAINPELILLDESFSQLDHATSRQLRRDFTLLAKEHRKTSILITHRIEDALDMADRLIVLGAPAVIRLEQKIDDALRNDSAWRAQTTEAISHLLEHN
jgi:NitT/TauT family transport system ATP-binding protein